MIFKKLRIKKHLIKNKMTLTKCNDAILFYVQGVKQKFISKWNGIYYIGNNEIYFTKKKLLLYKNDSILKDKVTWAIRANKYIKTQSKIIIDFEAPHNETEGVFSRLEIKL